MVETVLTDAASYPSSVVIDAKSLVELSDRLNGWDTDAKENSGEDERREKNQTRTVQVEFLIDQFTQIR